MYAYTLIYIYINIEGKEGETYTAARSARSRLRCLRLERQGNQVKDTATHQAQQVYQIKPSLLIQSTWYLLLERQEKQVRGREGR